MAKIKRKSTYGKPITYRVRREIQGNRRNPEAYTDVLMKCENCGKPYKFGTGQITVFGGWFCQECLD